MFKASYIGTKGKLGMSPGGHGFDGAIFVGHPVIISARLFSCFHYHDKPRSLEATFFFGQIK